jgi:hypothetical protein
VAITTIMNHRLSAGLLLLALALTSPVRAADSFTWDAKQKLISADAQSWPLPVLLQKIIAATGWQVFVEPGATATASAKFKDLSLGEGLHALLGDLNFALVPQTNAPPQLYVFHTTMQAATQLVSAAPDRRGKKLDTSKPIPNQLVITVKPGTDINALAAQLGAKVIGSVDGLNTYLLQFPDEAATAAARAALTSNPSVVSVDNNYPAVNPAPTTPLMASSNPFLNMTVKPASDGAPRVILLDTKVDEKNTCDLGGHMLPALSVASGTPVADGTPSHGTSMAETIVRAAGGNVMILPVDVYGASETTTTFNVAAGIYQGVNAGGTLVNMSLSSAGNSAFLQQVISIAHNKGVAFYAAAGNEPVTTPMYPAAYPEVVSVTAGSPNGDLASYANRNSSVAVVAPGNSVVCYGDQSWLVQGTSASSAWMSGQTAKVAANNSSTDMTKIQQAVVSAAVKPNL